MGWSQVPEATGLEGKTFMNQCGLGFPVFEGCNRSISRFVYAHQIDFINLPLIESGQNLILSNLSIMSILHVFNQPTTLYVFHRHPIHLREYH